MAVTRKVVLAVAVGAFAVFIGYSYVKLQKMRLATRELPVKHLKCQYLQHIDYGAEDILILKDGLAFMSTGLKFPALPSFSDDPGKMFSLDLLHPKPTPVELQIKGDLDLSSLNPHGISAYVDETDDSIYLFVVNHPEQKSQVEIFRYVEEDTLVHLKTIIHPLLHSVNDIVAVGAESFFATNTHYFENDLFNLLPLLLDWPLCDVVYYSPDEVRVAGGGISSANGINISPDEKYIYVSDIVDHEVDVFERQEGERLVFIKSVAVGSLCDNIDVDHKTGDLWLGCHPNSAKLLPFNPEDPPGSEVLKIQNIHSERPLVSQEYIDDGHIIMGSTVAARYEDKLLIGSAFHKGLYCDLK